MDLEKLLHCLITYLFDNIQEQLENPYNQIGEDDITVNMDEIKRMFSK